ANVGTRGAPCTTGSPSRSTSVRPAPPATSNAPIRPTKFRASSGIAPRGSGCSPNARRPSSDTNNPCGMPCGCAATGTSNDSPGTDGHRSARFAARRSCRYCHNPATLANIGPCTSRQYASHTSRGRSARHQQNEVSASAAEFSTCAVSTCAGSTSAGSTFARAASLTAVSVTPRPRPAVPLRSTEWTYPEPTAIVCDHRAVGWEPLAVGFAAGLLIAVVTAPVGVSGAVFLLPVQLAVLRVPSPAVTPTNLLFNVVSGPGALLRYRAQGQRPGVLTRTMLWGAVPGVLVGALVRVYLVPDARTFRLVAAAVLLPIGLWLIWRAVRGSRVPR